MAWRAKSSSKHLLHTSKARRFCLDIAPSDSKALRVVMAGVEHCDSAYVNARDGFPVLCIELVASGEGSLTLDGKDFKLTPGTLFCYGPGLPHEIRSTEKGSLVKYFVAFTGKPKDADCVLKPGAVLRTGSIERLVSSFESLIANGCAEEPHCKEICATSLETLLLVIADNVIPYGIAASKALESFQLARAKVDEGFLRLHDLQDIAALCNLEPSYLCRLFKRFASTTPYKYLLGVKMRHAAGIIRAERILVKELSGRLGYADPYQFSRVFKKVHGVSPENYALLVSRIL